MICIATALQTYIYKIDLTFGENSKLVGKTNKIFLWLERYLKKLAPCLLCIFKKKKKFHPKVPQLTRIRCAKSSRLFFQNCPIFQYRILSKLYGNILSYNLLYTNTPTPQKKTKRQDCHLTCKWPKKHITCKNNLISKNVQTILPYMMYTWKFLLICRNTLQLARRLFNCQRFTCGTEAINQIKESNYCYSKAIPSTNLDEKREMNNSMTH